MQPEQPRLPARWLIALIVLSALAGGSLHAEPALPPWHAEAVFREVDSGIDAALQAMSLEEKVGQMLMADSPGAYTEKDDPARMKLDRLVSEGKVGGIMFLKGSMFSAAMLANHFQSIAPNPLLISADMERGLAMRLEGATRFPSAMAVSAAGSSELSGKMGEAIALEAKAAGLQWNFAPSADLNSNPLNPVINTRSYGDTSEGASRMADALIEGMQSKGLLATAKHFPGHGDVTVDSHFALPVLEADSLRLEEYELKPFRSAIRCGVMAVMTGHLAVPKLTGTMDPASISAPIVTGLLRKRLGFKGLIVTDALNMKALYDGHNVEEISVRAVAAGNDVLLFSPDPERSFHAIVNAVRDSVISEARIDESVRRILQAKRWAGLRPKSLVDLNRVPEMASPARHIELAEAIAARSVTFTGKDRHIIPFRIKKAGPSMLHIILQDRTDPDVGSAFMAGIDSTWKSHHLRITPDTDPEKFIEAERLAETAPAIVIAAYITAPSKLTAPQLAFIHSIQKLSRGKRPVVFVAFGSPYMLRSFPGLENCICTYDAEKTSEQNALKVLTGRLEPKGKLPVVLRMDAPGDITTP
ncbi:glycoside hydrolase family 3 protein [Pelodictyon luteolum]|uniref:beta-N-acetylhexosaminidase n=1 Tax=Chlorobium luteolum (strain DSM 273 / BCRC 81028 / 2530) TaxID=319225 RepID=Q3B6L6_CHLL3|nr:glycoside hydrolase family 3 protein [Pelodictyon luteolum]ABB23015.1 beta-N-acetylglucosaminidase [Pelodictyon luteolum DSM 273]